MLQVHPTVRKILIVMALVVAPAGAAHARRPSVPALEATTVRAEPKEEAEPVTPIESGDKLILLGTRGDWTQVMTASGKRGWVKTTVVKPESDSKAGGDSEGDGRMEVARVDGTIGASEGSTALAIRGRPVVKKRTVVVGTGGLNETIVKRVADGLRKNPYLEVVDARSELGVKPGSPLGGVAGASQLGGAKEATVVVGLMGSGGSSLLYEVVDLEKQDVLVKGTTSDATDARIPVEEVIAAVADAVKPSSARGESEDEADSGDPAVESKKDAVTPHPNAPLEGTEKKGKPRGWKFWKKD